MDTFTSRTATTAAAPDPSKHVNYSYGMVLGVDDLTQEFAYLTGRDQWMMRDSIGYGTLSGLRVSVDKDTNGETEVTVGVGTALTPRGQLVCVSPRQCANLNKWLTFEKNRETIQDLVPFPPGGTLRLYVVLCYRDCPTDNVPIPGEPCRTEQEATAPSRVKDSFSLEFRFNAPEQTEEDALRDFIKWLNDHLVLTDEADALTDLPTFIKRLRQAAQDAAAHPQSPPDFLYDSPFDVMNVSADDACQFFRTAFRLWVTELRPLWRPARFGATTACADDTDATRSADDNCVLLAELNVPLDATGVLDATQEIEINEERRPYLIHLRLLQEWLTCGAFDMIEAAAATSASPAVEPAPVLPFVSITRKRDDPQQFQLWFQLDARDNDVAVTSIEHGALTAFAEQDDTSAYRNRLKPLRLELLKPTWKEGDRQRNRFDVKLDASDGDLVRLHFDMSHIRVLHGRRERMSLTEYARRENVRFVGQVGKAIVTAFFSDDAETLYR
ncbi:MAG: hypothetical protein QOF61_2488 [Acidobacteriota bacterium]|nr:hypothetical protein [Acidobacteriota bacterium]